MEIFKMSKLTFKKIRNNKNKKSYKKKLYQYLVTRLLRNYYVML